jgi:hypothetical protein
MTFPPIPSVPEHQCATGKYPLRFEDLSQDGRAHFEPLVASIDAAIWRPMLARVPTIRDFHAAGVRPIFTRLMLEVGPGQLTLGTTLTAEGTYELSHEPDGKGGARRLFLKMWTKVWADPDKHRDARVYIGRLFAEHQLTKILAPPGQRRVTSLPGGLAPPTATYEAPRPETLLELEEEAEWLEPTEQRDVAPVAFGFSHTDSNQHVNSLVYPRLFGDAALRRFAALGADTKTLPVGLHIAFRKPFFAGDAAEIVLRAYRGRHVREPGAVGTLRAPARAGDEAGEARPHVYVNLSFSKSPDESR